MSTCHEESTDCPHCGDNVFMVGCDEYHDLKAALASETRRADEAEEKLAQQTEQAVKATERYEGAVERAERAEAALAAETRRADEAERRVLDILKARVEALDGFNYLGNYEDASAVNAAAHDLLDDVLAEVEMIDSAERKHASECACDTYPCDCTGCDCGGPFHLPGPQCPGQPTYDEWKRRAIAETRRADGERARFVKCGNILREECRNHEATLSELDEAQSQIRSMEFPASEREQHFESLQALRVERDLLAERTQRALVELESATRNLKGRP